MIEKNRSHAEQEPSPEISLRRATQENVEDILRVEKSLEGLKTYSALTDREEVIAEITNSIFYLIEQNSVVVGDTSYEMKDGNHAYISGLAIMPEFQGRGIAKQTMAKILKELKDVDLIDLVTHPENEASIQLYESLGFKIAGEVQENYFDDGEPRIKMVLERKKEK